MKIKSKNILALCDKSEVLSMQDKYDESIKYQGFILEISKHQRVKACYQTIQYNIQKWQLYLINIKYESE